jgi:hypothetical protein
MARPVTKLTDPSPIVAATQEKTKKKRFLKVVNMYPQNGQ